ncbi:MAG: anion transporter [Alphaproteobacteria bacterium]|nr:MAG: anion transporter [Alphaproteobacteria bacterium]
MTPLIVLVFALTYAGMAIGRVPGLRLDRAGIAMIAAVLLSATGAIAPPQVIEAVHFPTLLLLGSLMILSARLRVTGFYDALARRIAEYAARPHLLLALTILIGGLLSAFLVNDVVVFALTPLLCAGIVARGLDPRPYLLGLAAASNAGSAATLIGNPQNILIGQVGRLDFWGYFATALPPALLALLLTFIVIALIWRKSLTRPATGTAPASAPLDRAGIGISATGLLVLLILFATTLPREISCLLVAACLILSRRIASRQLFDEIDVPLLLLFAGLFIVNAAFAGTGLPKEALQYLTDAGFLPTRLSLLAPLALVASNTIGNVPAVVLLLEIWQTIPEGVMTGLALLSTLAGNFLLIGSLSNLIVAERAAASGITIGFVDHAKVGIPITLLSLGGAVLWLWALGLMPI